MAGPDKLKFELQLDQSRPLRYRNLPHENAARVNHLDRVRRIPSIARNLQPVEF